ncbi:hypothetical protein ACT6QH_02060 [Xanthobacter sp. TB0139]|uniref:hypothetical protein n=1 Tax=Xanthobacter sp. TB0139 TaxID=3459178 RepID=UPI00403A5123
MRQPSGRGVEPAARRHRRADYLSLKGAMRRLVEACGGQESAASVTRVAPQTLSRYGHPQEHVFAPVDVVADLEADADAALVTRELAALTGHVLVRLPQGVAGQGRWVRHISDIVQDASALTGRLARALEDDGRVTADEVRGLGLRGAIREAMEGLAALDAELVALKREGAE